MLPTHSFLPHIGASLLQLMWLENVFPNYYLYWIAFLNLQVPIFFSTRACRMHCGFANYPWDANCCCPSEGTRWGSLSSAQTQPPPNLQVFYRFDKSAFAKGWKWYHLFHLVASNNCVLVKRESMWSSKGLLCSPTAATLASAAARNGKGEQWGLDRAMSLLG